MSTKPCIDCGTTLTQEPHQKAGAWARKTRCTNCEALAKKERDAEAKIRWNRKNGLPVHNTPISEIVYGKDIEIIINGKKCKRHYDELHCHGCGGFMPVRRIIEGPRKGLLPRSSEHNKRMTHGRKCHDLLKSKQMDGNDNWKGKADRYQSLPLIGKLWGTDKPKRIFYHRIELSTEDLWHIGKIGQVFRPRLKLAA